MDLRWGVTADATNDHAVEKICEKEIRNCQEVSQGPNFVVCHYNDVIMSTMASQTTGVSMVSSTVCSGADQRKHQSLALLALVRGIHR